MKLLLRQELRNKLKYNWPVRRKTCIRKETIKEAMTEKVDSYLNYVVEEWMKENELAVEEELELKSLKTSSLVLKTYSKNTTLMFLKKNIMYLMT